MEPVMLGGTQQNGETAANGDASNSSSQGNSGNGGGGGIMSKISTYCCCCFRFCCCCSRGKVDPNKPVEPVFTEDKDRKCTDCFFLVLFILWWIGMFVIAGIGFAEGDPDKLLHGTDYQGRTCGSEGLGEKIYYPRITEDLIAAVGVTNPLDVTLFGVCVEECPTANSVVCTDEGTPALAEAKTRLGATQDVETLTLCKQYDQFFQSDCATARKNCWVVPLRTTEYLFRCVWIREKVTIKTEICVSPPILAGKTRGELEAAGRWDECVTKATNYTENTIGEAQPNPLFDLIYSGAEMFGRVMGDVGKALPVIIVCGGIVSFLMGFVWLLLIKCAAGCMVWFTIWSALALMIVATIVAYFKAGILNQDHINSATSSFNEQVGTSMTLEVPSELDKGDEDLMQRWSYAAYTMTALTFVLLVLILWARKTIRLAIGIVKEASQALRSMKVLLIYPVVTFACLTLLILYFIFVAVFIASTGDEITNNTVLSSAQSLLQAPSLLCAVNETTGQIEEDRCDELLTGTEFEADNVKRYMLAYHLFGLLWTNQFIQAIGVMIVSGAVSRWYFTLNKVDDLPKYPVCSAARRTFRYHLGSVAFGSLVIAIVQFVRAMLEYLDRKTKIMQDKSKFWAFVMKCVKCCLWLFEKCIKFITKFAFIIVAMKGKSFCSSAKMAVMMLIAHAKQIAVVETITMFLFFLGKVFIVATSCLLAFAWLEKAPNYQEGEDDELDSMLVPMGVVAILSYAIAQTFLGIYLLSIETILLCFCEDRDKHDGTPENPYYMSDRMKRIIGASVRSAKSVATDSVAGDIPEDDLVKPFNQGGGYDSRRVSAAAGGADYGAGAGSGAGVSAGPGGYAASASAPVPAPQVAAPAPASMAPSNGGYGGGGGPYAGWA